VRGVALRHGPGLHWTLAPLRFTPWVVRLLRACEVDVLRAHSVRHAAPSLLLARALARSRVPIVVHHHHLTERWGFLEALIVRRADAVITVSARSAAELTSRGVQSERIHVVPDGVERPPRTAGWPEAWPAVGEGLRLLELGRLEPRKRPELGIDVVAELRSRGVDASLVIAGGGPMEPELRARARGVRLGERVRLLGRVSEADKWRLYDAADALVFGSTLEGFGIVVAEAQSRGVPVVAAAGTATAEALDPGASGWLVAPTAAAFADALAPLADPTVRAAAGKRAEAFARRFDWDASAARVAAIYRQLLP
jgi:glycosyltransferase involved in cell wall biosynthesis